jgi:LysM repeat protein
VVGRGRPESEPRVVRRTLLAATAVAAVAIVIVAIVIGVSTYKSTAEDIAAGTYSPPRVSIGSLSGVVATGDLHPVSAAVSATGHVTITAERSAGSFRISITHFQGATGASGEKRSVNLSSEAVDTTGNNTCAPAGLTFSFGDVAEKPQQTFELPGSSLGGPAAENPSYLQDLTITEVSEVSGAEACPVSLVAYAPLHWTIPDLRPDIKVVDKGWEPGATGAVVTRSGHPFSYTVVAGDSLSGIALRFSLTLNELLYLNPARLPGATDSVAPAGEVINLSKSNR